MAVLGPALGLLGTLGCTGGGPAGDAAASTLRPTRGYILISLDTLRADHLSLYGYARETSPFLESLAPRSIVFDLAIAHFPNTLASHMSIFTGLYPAEHGVYPPGGELAADVETLPEAFARAGFRTAGFTEGGYMRGRPGFRRGFDAWKADGRRHPRAMERTFERGLDFLRGLEDGDGFFVFLHTYAPHAPYDPPEPYRGLYWPAPPPTELRPSDRELTLRNTTGERLPDDTLAYFVALYDATLRYADDVLASFFAELTTLGLAADTTIVITSDHGEEFQDHGRLAHTQLYHETMRVPLVLVHPDLASGLRWRGLVESVDLAPTFYALAGIEPETPPSGRDLLRVLSATQLAATGRPRADARAWVEGGPSARALYRQSGDDVLHLIEHGPAGADDTEVELYDVGADAAERRDVSGERARAAAVLLDELRGRRLVARSSMIERELDPAEVEELRALGYL